MAQGPEAPAEDGYPQKLALQDPPEGGEKGGEGDGLPGALMVTTIVFDDQFNRMSVNTTIFVNFLNGKLAAITPGATQIGRKIRDETNPNRVAFMVHPTQKNNGKDSQKRNKAKDFFHHHKPPTP